MNERITKPNALAAYTVVVLQHGAAYLLLQRAQSKRFAPGRWTGIGGMVEPEEYADLQASALRELAEESGIAAAAVENFALRRVVLHARPAGPLTVLLYFTGRLATAVTPACNEGTLHWVRAEQMTTLDIIETTQAVLPPLLADLARDPAGQEYVHLGLADYQADGTFVRVIWT